MVDQVKTPRSCSYIVSCTLGLFSILYLFKQEFFYMILLLSIGLVIVLPCHFLGNSCTIRFLRCYLIVCVNFTIFITQTITGRFTPSPALYICAGALSMLFFSIMLVRLSFICSIALFLLEAAILSARADKWIEDPLVLAQCLLAILVGFVLTHLSVKNEIHYLTESASKQEEVQKIAENLSEKTAHNEEMVQEQQDLLLHVAAIAGNISTEAKSLSGESESLACGATQQAASVQQVYAAVETFSSQMKNTVDLAQRIQTDSREMNLYVEEGGTHMGGMLSAVKKIEDSMLSIEHIIKTINDIAFQTNILALNAAVEAARAGEAGKGFAVVADEVRALASNSAKAAKETMEVLSSCQHAVDHGAAVARQTSDALGKIKDSVENVAHRAVDISGVATDQLTTMDKIKEEMNQVSGVIQTTAASAGQVAAMVKEISRQSDQLDTLGR